MEKNYTEKYYEKGNFSLKIVRGNDGKIWGIDLYKKNYKGAIGTIEVSYGTDIKEVMNITNGQPIVTNISVDEFHRNEGIAKLLYKELIELLKKDGWEKLYSSTTRNSRFVDNLWNTIKTGDISVEYDGKIKKIDYIDLKTKQLKEGDSIGKGTFKPLGSAKELGITPKIAHDMIAQCDCGEKFSYQNSKKNILWQCPECNGMKRIKTS